MKWMKSEDIPKPIWDHQGEKIHISKCESCGKNYYSIITEETKTCPKCEVDEEWVEESRDRIRKTLEEMSSKKAET